MNRLELQASIVERDALRYTPAGIPVSACLLRHASRQLEANQERAIEFEVAAVTIGALAASLNQLELGRICRFCGFLARKRRNSKSLVYHITDFELNTED